MDSAEFDGLRDAVEKLTLNDASVPVEKETSLALGMGYRCGFLGMLHMDVFLQRLQQEYGTEVLATPPTVPYKGKPPPIRLLLIFLILQLFCGTELPGWFLIQLSTQMRKILITPKSLMLRQLL